MKQNKLFFKNINFIMSVLVLWLHVTENQLKQVIYLFIYLKDIEQISHSTAKLRLSLYLKFSGKWRNQGCEFSWVFANFFDCWPHHLISLSAGKSGQRLVLSLTIPAFAAALIIFPTSGSKALEKTSDKLFMSQVAILRPQLRKL